MNKSVLENVIKSGKFDLARATALIESGYVAGEYSEEEHIELLALRDQYLNPASQAPEVLEVLKRLEEKYAVLEERVKALEGNNEETYPAWRPWNGIPGSGYQHGVKVSHNGFVWESCYQGENVWEPGTLGTERIWVKAE